MLQRMSQITLLILVLVLSSCVTGPKPAVETLTAEAVKAEPLELKLIAFNDCHGHLQGPSGTVTIDGERVEAIG